jgi:integrase
MLTDIELPPFVVAEDLDAVRIDTRPDPNALTPLAVALPADIHPAFVYLATLAPGSRRTMRRALAVTVDMLTASNPEMFVENMPWHQLRYQHMAALRSWLMENYDAATGNKILSAVRGVLVNAWQLGQIDTDAYMKAIKVKAIKGEKPDAAAGRALSAGEISALLRVCADDPTPAGVRDACILGLGVYAGLRRDSIAKLQIANYDADRRQLTVTTKRNKTLALPIEAGLAAALDDWLLLRGSWPGPLLCVVRKGGRVERCGISGAAVYRALAKRGTQAGLKPFTPHDLRRTFAGDLLDAGADIATVQRLMGHANTNTTAGYDRRGERAKREAVGRLHMAWTRRG